MSHLARSLFDLHQKMNLRQIFHLLTSTTTVVCRECRHPLLHGRDVNFVYRISGRGRTVLGLMGKADITAAAKGRINQRDLRLKFLWTSSSLQCGNCRSQLGILRVVRNGSPASGLPPVSQARGTPLNVRAVLSNGASLAVTSPWTGQGVLYSPRNWLDLDAEQIVDTGVKTSHSFVGLFHNSDDKAEAHDGRGSTEEFMGDLDEIASFEPEPNKRIGEVDATGTLSTEEFVSRRYAVFNLVRQPVERAKEALAAVTSDVLWRIARQGPHKWRRAANELLISNVDWHGDGHNRAAAALEFLREDDRPISQKSVMCYIDGLVGTHWPFSDEYECHKRLMELLDVLAGQQTATGDDMMWLASRTSDILEAVWYSRQPNNIRAIAERIVSLRLPISPTGYRAIVLALTCSRDLDRMLLVTGLAELEPPVAKPNAQKHVRPGLLSRALADALAMVRPPLAIHASRFLPFGSLNDVIQTTALYSGQAARGIRLLRAFQERFPSVDATELISNGVLLDLYAKGTDWETAKQLYNKFAENGTVINYVSARHLNGLVAAAVKAGDMTTAFHILATARQQGGSRSVQPDPQTFSILMSGCRNRVEVNRTKAVFNLKGGQEQRPVRQMAEMYANAGMLDDLELLYRDHAGLWNPRQPSRFAMNNLLLAYCSNGRVSEAVALLREHCDRGFQPNESTYIVLFNALVDSDLQLAVELWEDALNRGMWSMQTRHARYGELDLHGMAVQTAQVAVLEQSLRAYYESLPESWKATTRFPWSELAQKLDDADQRYFLENNRRRARPPKLSNRHHRRRIAEAERFLDKPVTGHPNAVFPAKIITGRGNRSVGQPVLNPLILQMLSELYPQLRFHSRPGAVVMQPRQLWCWVFSKNITQNNRG